MLNVDVLVLTYKRSHWLEGTLQSLVQQRLEQGIQMSIVVVDNDAAQSAYGVVAGFQEKFPRTRYVCEPRPNVANARNRALREASGDFAAFIDDDELAEPHWLQRLIETQRRYAVPVVFGPVVAELPRHAPRWAVEGRFYERPRFATGSEVSSGGTGNVLLELAVLRRVDVRFDPSYGLSGGEDTWFFHQLTAAGQRLVWCDEAVARERVPDSRLRVAWLMRRAFSGGHSYSRMFDGARGVGSRAARTVLRLMLSAGSLLLAPFALSRGIPGVIRVMQFSMRNLGRGIGSWHDLGATRRSRGGTAARAT